MDESFFSGLNFVLQGALLNCSLCMKQHPRYYGIQYVHKGPVYLSAGDGPMYNLEGPVLFFTSPETMFAYGSPKGTSREHYHICVNGERIKQYIKFGLFPLAVNQPQPYYKIYSPNQFLSEMLSLMALISDNGKYEFAVCQYEHLLLSVKNQQIQKSRNNFYQRDFEQLIQKILKNPESDFNYSEIAKNLGISEKHFLRIFLKDYGMPPHHFLLQQRLLKACSLLILKKDPIKVIAGECGFSDPYYFSRLFKKYMQTTPEQYRKVHCFSA